MKKLFEDYGCPGCIFDRDLKFSVFEEYLKGHKGKDYGNRYVMAYQLFQASFFSYTSFF